MRTTGDKTRLRSRHAGLQRGRGRGARAGAVWKAVRSDLGLRFMFSLVLVISLLFGGCFKGEEGEQFYGKVFVPAAQEFRWSDGGLPRVFDPARAAAPPDTDAVRALFEGLTDYEPGTLRPAPAVATSWESAEGGRKWTFHLRADARWSNGDPVTAQDFVRSWQRTLRLGDRAPHAKLLANIEGTQTPAQPTLGVVALDSHTLRVSLQRPDRNFPALVAHPVFRPVHELSPSVDLPELQEEQRQDGGARRELGIITNGAFSLSRLAADGVELERAPGYWDADSVKLERVRFVDKGDTDAALAAYREGEVEAVTNAGIEPLAVKLLTPYKDFRRETFAALNYYSFNTARAPFDDRRVREALACALDIERLSADTLGGATEPARRFLPAPSEDEGDTVGSLAADVGKSSRAETAVKNGSTEAEVGSGAAEMVVRPGGSEGGGDAAFEHNVGRARGLLAGAGFPGGANFPRIRLLVNRNEQQRLVAQAVARMWHDALGVETDIIVRGWEDYVAMLRSGDYDVARRSLVMQTTDEETNMRGLFGDEAPVEESAPSAAAGPQSSPVASPVEGGGATAANATPPNARREPPILSEAEALRELPAIPIHFASSYALVKPYVNGFESNLLDAPSLKGVSINTDWRSPSEPARLALGVRR